MTKRACFLPNLKPNWQIEEWYLRAVAAKFRLNFSCENVESLLKLTLLGELRFDSVLA